jgi:hypothetical protein
MASSLSIIAKTLSGFSSVVDDFLSAMVLLLFTASSRCWYQVHFRWSSFYQMPFTQLDWYWTGLYSINHWNQSIMCWNIFLLPRFAAVWNNWYHEEETI